ncbi:hypothetical protein [Amycolatopsis thermoflava]|uniref:hypothetical protein n=1 Tax=Amycolatopsis thermoflava TaxID=84480 RepID=UPI00040B8AF8|nr:hypothetical protein [Amycolatopsis thermoflava]
MTVMQQLPLPPAEFVDRDPLLVWMTERVEAARAAGRPAYLALYGPAGVGVRSLVYEWYARQSAQFPDGAVRVPLSDVVSGGDAMAFEALGDVIADLGVARDELPSSAEARKNLLLTRTYAKRLMMVLEEAGNGAQVEHFLLNSPASAVVVVSRSRLRKLDLLGFEARAVDPLDERFGVELFDRMLGAGWSTGAGVSPAAVTRVCGGYPLAIRATVAQIATTPEWEVPDLLRDLAGRGLGALDPESQEFVRDSFDRAYQRLSPEQARAYRLVVGLYPGSVVFVDAASVLLDEPEDVTRKRLAALVAAHLLTRVGPDRFEFHDVAHWHARDRAEAEEPFPEQRAAVERVARWYLRQTVSRDRMLSDRPRYGPCYQEPAGGGVSREAALHWLEERRANLRTVVAFAQRFQLLDLVWQMCEALWGVYHLHGHYEEWITTHRMGVEAAVQLGDPRVRMRMTSQLAAALLGTGDHDEAWQVFTDSHQCAIQAGDPVGAESALEWLGKVATRKGEFDTALRLYQQAWNIAASDVPEHLRPRMFALLWLQRARTMVLAGRNAEARDAANHAVEYFSGTAESDNLAKSLLVLAQAGGGAATAVEAARRAAVLFRQDESLRAEAEALETVVRVAPNPEDEARLQHVRQQLEGRG